MKKESALQPPAVEIIAPNDLRYAVISALAEQSDRPGYLAEMPEILKPIWEAGEKIAAMNQAREQVRQEAASKIVRHNGIIRATALLSGGTLGALSVECANYHDYPWAVTLGAGAVAFLGIGLKTKHKSVN